MSLSNHEWFGVFSGAEVTSRVPEESRNSEPFFCSVVYGACVGELTIAVCGYFRTKRRGPEIKNQSLETVVLALAVAGPFTRWFQDRQEGNQT
jgi:hypothetical protein